MVDSIKSAFERGQLTNFIETKMLEWIEYFIELIESICIDKIFIQFNLIFLFQ